MVSRPDDVGSDKRWRTLFSVQLPHAMRAPQRAVEGPLPRPRRRHTGIFTSGRKFLHYISPPPVFQVHQSPFRNSASLCRRVLPKYQKRQADVPTRIEFSFTHRSEAEPTRCWVCFRGSMRSKSRCRSFPGSPQCRRRDAKEWHCCRRVDCGAARRAGALPMTPKAGEFARVGLRMEDWAAA